ncbi:MBL fold metallo-hydrolase [Paenibacillus sp. CC-CFT747]|nr:MBL fold metallo-hydrolase [Paenibacillus sp. CC-CFT747]
MLVYRDESLAVFQSALYQTTSTVVWTRELVLVTDPCWLPGEVQEIRSFVDSVRGERPCYLLFTHGDFDHILGWKAFPEARTIGSRGLHHHPEKEKQLLLIREFDAAHYVDRGYPVDFPVLDHVMEEDGQKLVLGETVLTFYLAPGHTEDGLFTVVEPLGLLLAGDYLSDFERPFVSHSASAYEETLEKALALLNRHAIRHLVPGHGRHTADRTEMRRRLTLAQDYLARLKRAVLEGDEGEMKRMKGEHAYPSAFTEECHRENIRIIRAELGLDEK